MVMKGGGDLGEGEGEVVVEALEEGAVSLVVCALASAPHSLIVRR